MKFGGKEDIDAIFETATLGVKLLLTAHGNDLKDVQEDMIKNKLFTNIIFLSKNKKPGNIEKIYILKEDKYVIAS